MCPALLLLLVGVVVLLLVLVVLEGRSGTSTSLELSNLIVEFNVHIAPLGPIVRRCIPQVSVFMVEWPSRPTSIL
jgi:hypothetical protein